MRLAISVTADRAGTFGVHCHACDWRTSLPHSRAVAGDIAKAHNRGRHRRDCVIDMPAPAETTEDGAA